MTDQNMIRFGQPATIQIQQQQQQQQQHDQYRRQQMALYHHQQQQSPPQQPPQLRNPTPYHIQQQQGHPLPPTPVSSFTNTIDPNLITPTHLSYQQIHQAQQIRHAQQQVKQETGSPNFSGSDMDYGDSSQNLVSPVSQSPIASPTNANTQYEELGLNFSNQHPQFHHARQSSQPLQHPPLQTDHNHYPNSPPTGSGPYSPDTNGDASSEFYDEPFVVSPHTTSKGIPVPGNIGMNGTGAAVAGSYGGHNAYGTSPSSLTGPPVFGQSVPVQKGNWFGSVDSANGFPTTRYSASELFEEGNETDDVQQRNLQQIFEKRRKRRESHNAVERRRRDNINEKIHELSTLLPEYMNEGPTCPSSAAGQKPNKGAILRKSVDHIKNLQTEVMSYQRRVHELEQVLDNLQRTDPSLIASLGIPFMSGATAGAKENGANGGGQSS